MAQSDWRDARRQVNAARRAWLTLRGRLAVLASRREALDEKLTQQADRCASQLLDDRINLEFIAHG